MTDTSSGAGAAPVAIALVHGIGAIHPQDMIRSVSAALEPNLPDTSFHDWIKVIDTPNGVQLCQKESRSGRPITIASAYWGDVCQVGESVIDVLGGLLTNIFGLRFFARAALRGAGPLRHLLWLTNISIVWITATVIYPLNIVALIYSLFLLGGHALSTGALTGTGSLGDLTYAAGLAAAVVIVGGTGALLKRQWSKPDGGVLIALLITQIAIAVIGLVILTVDHFKLVPLGELLREIMARYGTRVLDPRWVDLGANADPRILHLSFLSFCQVMAGILVIATAIFAIPLTLLSWVLSGFKARVWRSALLALSSSLAAWLFVLMVTWPENIATSLAIGTVTAPKSYSTHWVEAVLLSCLVLIGLTAFTLVFLRLASGRRSAERELSRYAPPQLGVEPDFKVGPRLIFSTAIQAVLIGLALLIIAISLSHAAGSTLVPQTFDMPQAWINLGAIAVIVAFVVAAPVFRYGAKTLMDIVDHFSFPARGFPVRERISQRLRGTIKHLVEQTNRPDLVILSHSQGTIISVDALLDPEFQRWLAPRVRTVTLLTFGSPFEHIYRHYFHAEYAGELPPEFEAFAEQVDFRWTNTFRCDDFVGTFIRGRSRFAPHNVALGIGGHVDYWRPEVFARLVQEGRVVRELGPDRIPSDVDAAVLAR